MTNPEALEMTPDLPRVDQPVDLKWWTRKLFEQLAYSEFGEFDEETAIETIKEQYGVQEPDEGDAWWALQYRISEVSLYDEYDFKPGDVDRIIDDITRYDDMGGEA